ncbi:MAG: hypothetical protein AAFU51_12935 [Bacteroidota bacterium]
MQPPAPSEPRRAPRWVRWSVAAFMAVWASGQLVVVQTQGLSSWRAGGFGMYASFHPVQRDAWVQAEGQEELQRFWKKGTYDVPVFEIVRPHLTFPRPGVLQDALDAHAAAGHPRYAVEITTLSFDVETRTLSHSPVLKVAATGFQSPAEPTPVPTSAATPAED